MLGLRLLKLRVVLAVAVLIAVVASNRYTLGRFSDVATHGLYHRDVPVPVITTTLMVGEASDVFQKINNQRRRYKLKPLYWNERLSEMAAAYSKQMADEDFFSHFDPDGKSVVDRAEEFEITDWKKIGENLFISEGFTDVSGVAVKGWMKSRTHKANILDREWTHTGVGIYKTDGDRTYITQVFMMK